MVQQSRNFRNSYSDIIYRITGKAPIHHTLYSSPLMNLHVYFSLVVTQPLDLHYTCNGPSSKYHTGESEAEPLANPTHPKLWCPCLAELISIDLLDFKNMLGKSIGAHRKHEVLRVFI